MVPKIVAKGRSFKGAAAYLLHDKGGAESAERVDWVETRNLATENPELAWRIMAATALDQDRLKEAAGVRKTGRKSDQAALHLVLSWHPDELEGLSRDEMRRAALGALRAIGADDRQAMLIAHNDEAHAHVHVLCNRVSPQDGRMLSSSKDRLKLSKWAQGYEMERGQVLCENRVVNNERRARGEFVADETALPYHQAANDTARTPPGSSAGHDAVKARQTAEDRRLVERGQALAEEHRTRWSALQERFAARKADIQAHAREEIGRARARIGRAYHALRLEQNQEQAAERAQFEEREARLLGRISNAMAAIDHVRRVRGEDRGATIGQGFKVFASAGARRDALAASHAEAKARLDRQQSGEEKAAKTVILDRARSERRAALSEYEASRASLVERQAAETADLRAAWRERTRERAAAWGAYRAAQDLPYELGSAFEDAASPEAKRRKDGDDRIARVLDDLDRLYDELPEVGEEAEHDHDDDYEY